MSNPEISPVQKGTEPTLTIESLAYGGRGVARIDDFVIFVDGAVPGQTVKARIFRKKKGYAEARTLEVVKKSPTEIAPRCEHFPTCGGCKIQQLDYAEQVRQKEQQVTDTFRRLAELPDFSVDKVIPADDPYHYRNKMEFSFSNRRWVLPEEPENADRSFALGLHIPKRYDKILDISECHIQQPLGNDILRQVRAIAKSEGLKPYDVKTHNGFLRYLVLRFGIHTGEIMVNLVTSYENPDLLAPVVYMLQREFPQVTSIINNINTRKGDTAYGEWELVLHGEPVITERLADLVFDISANSFFQTNTLQAERLYQATLDGAELTGDETVYDLYCGTGSIALFMARKTREVHGFEVVSPAVEDANRNAEANNIGNTEFHKVNLDTFFKSGARRKEFPAPEVVIVDPPRSGMHKSMTQQLPHLGANRIVYVSCNPTTQARDAQVLLHHGYRLEHVTLVDMFPHTAHIETVGVFVRD